MQYAVITEAVGDGTLSVIGPFASEYEATVWANGEETEASGYICHVRPLENP